MSKYFNVKQFAAGLLCSLTIGLVGCSLSSVSVEDVQNATKIACAFVPSVKTVIDIVAKDNETYDTVAEISASICALAENKAPANARRALAETDQVTVGTLDGVTVEGTFVTTK